MIALLPEAFERLTLNPCLVQHEEDVMPPTTRYTKSGDVHIAYQVFGEGPANLVLAPGFISNIRLNSQIDTTDILPAIRVPTLIIHKTDDTTVAVEGGRTLARAIPNARLFEMPGTDHLPWADDHEVYVRQIEQFLTGQSSVPIVDRVLATVLFTDIVESTALAERLGDRAWNDLLGRHDREVRKLFERFRGREVKSLGDGFLAVFDGPARAIQCARAIRETLASMPELQVRMGLHTGEIEWSGEDIRGLAVHITARVADRAGPGSVLVTRTVKDLVAGSQIVFQPAGSHLLKGVPEEWQLYSVV